MQVPGLLVALEVINGEVHHDRAMAHAVRGSLGEIVSGEFVERIAFAAGEAERADRSIVLRLDGGSVGVADDHLFAGEGGSGERHCGITDGLGQIEDGVVWPRSNRDAQLGGESGIDLLDGEDGSAGEHQEGENDQGGGHEGAS